MPRSRPLYLHKETSRHDKTVWYVRVGKGPRVRLTAEYGSDSFWGQYRSALNGKPAERTAPKTRSLEWAIDRYRASPEWADLAGATRKQRENIYKAVIATAGGENLGEFDKDSIRDGRDRRAATPHSANNFLKAMRGLFGWLLDRDMIKSNPTIGVRMLSGANDDVGFHTWTQDELAKFEGRWPLGTRERLAYDLVLYTGLRRGDVVRLGRQHVRSGVLCFPRTEKGKATITIPLLAPLAASITAAKVGDLAFLVTEHGLPFVKEGFGNWFGDVCRATGVPGSAHGLRKSGATRAAENGASEKQLMALFGWKSAKMATHYTKAADQKRLAMEAAKLLLLNAQSENENALTDVQGEGVKPKTLMVKGS